MKYGWKPDIPDHRDLFRAMPRMATLPGKVDPRPGGLLCPVFDQQTLGSCTANAISAAYVFEKNKQGGKQCGFTPSRLFIYYNERAVEGTIGQDAGAMIRDGMKVVNKYGCAPEKDWPYIVARFQKKPTSTAFGNALAHQSLKYARVNQTLLDMKNSLAQALPIVLGFTVYESFESQEVAKSGIVPMPGKDEKSLGGHAVLCVGYDDADSRFIVQNSWGTGWGDKGFFHIPYDYLVNPNLACDLWNISLVE